jgi:hypothetical protein
MATARDLYEKYARCVVRIAVRTTADGRAIGTGYHIGAGYLVTARHVVANGTIEGIYTDGSSDALCTGEVVQDIFYHADDRVDLAVLATNLGYYWHENKPRIIMGDRDLEIAECIPLGGHLDDFLGDELVMTKALILGFPPVPFSKYPVLVAAEGEINAIICPSPSIPYW